MTTRRSNDYPDVFGFPWEVAMRAQKVYDKLKTVTSEQEAVEVMRGETYEVFRFIDEKPGWIDGRYAWCEGWVMLRRARNDRDSNLFDVLVRG